MKTNSDNSGKGLALFLAGMLIGHVGRNVYLSWKADKQYGISRKKPKFKKKS